MLQLHYIFWKDIYVRYSLCLMMVSPNPFLSCLGFGSLEEPFSVGNAWFSDCPVWTWFQNIFNGDYDYICLGLPWDPGLNVPTLNLRFDDPYYANRLININVIIRYLPIILVFTHINNYTLCLDTEYASDHRIAISECEILLN